MKNYLPASEFIGKTFGRLLVLEQVFKENKRDRIWRCRCQNDGNIIDVTSNHLTSGHTQSCGCFGEESRGQSQKKKNTFDLSNKYGICFLNEDKYFIFDLEDYEKIRTRYWWCDKNGYPCSNKSVKNKTEKVYLHRIIMNPSKPLVVDHINGNKLDNRKNNLRICSSQENTTNSKISKNNKTGITGVFINNRNNKYTAKIKKNYVNHYLGDYKNFEDAIIARLKAEKELFGEFAPQRHLFEEYGI